MHSPLTGNGCQAKCVWGRQESGGREGSLSFSAFPHQCKEMCDESQVNMEIIINYILMDRNALFWLGNQLVSSGGLPDVKNKEECVCVCAHVGVGVGSYKNQCLETSENFVLDAYAFSQGNPAPILEVNKY